MSTEAPSGAIVQIIEQAFGTLLVGALLNCVLFGLELSQLYTYYKLFPTDRAAIRALVIFMFLVDCCSTANSAAMVYQFTILGWGNMAVLGGANNTVPVYSISMAVSVICMHAFLIYRYIVLSKNWAIAGVLTLLAIAAFVGDMLATWSVLKYTTLDLRYKLRPYAIIWLSCASSADVLIALSLIWELSRIKSSFRKTNSLIKRLMTNAIMTGSLTAVLALLTLATYLGSTTTNICLTFGFMMGRLCTLTVVYNLNMRKQSGHYLSSGETNQMTNNGNGSTVPMETGFQFGASKTAISGINVHSVTQIEGKDDDHHSYDDKPHARAIV